MYLSGMYPTLVFELPDGLDDEMIEPCHQSADNWPLIARTLPFLNDSSLSLRPL
jgi:hypothetical protein